MNRSMLDQPQILQVLFHPRPETSDASAIPGARPVSFKVEPDISVGGWLFPAEADAPAVLFFHGNGEIAISSRQLTPNWV